MAQQNAHLHVLCSNVQIFTWFFKIGGGGKRGKGKKQPSSYCEYYLYTCIRQRFNDQPTGQSSTYQKHQLAER